MIWAVCKNKIFFMVLFLKFISVNSVSCLIPQKRFFNVTPNPFGVPGGVSVTKSMLLLLISTILNEN